MLELDLPLIHKKGDEEQTMPRGRPSSDPVKLVRLALAAIDSQIAELQEKRRNLQQL
jgi:hypothetical protein